jgi:hypothetical protein
MDLIPRNRSIEAFHANWTSWAVIAEAVAALGGDVTKLSGSNDGVYIDTATLKSWAKLMEEGHEQLYVISNGDLDLVRKSETGYELFAWCNAGYSVCPIRDWYDGGTFVEEFVTFCRTSRGCWQW